MSTTTEFLYRKHRVMALVNSPEWRKIANDYYASAEIEPDLTPAKKFLAENGDSDSGLDLRTQRCQEGYIFGMLRAASLGEAEIDQAVTEFVMWC